MLEIGSHEGRSAIWFVQNLLIHPDSRLTCVDTWFDAEARFQRFQKNIKLAGVADKIQVYRKSSRHINPEGEGYDLIYLDGDHQSASVFLDLAVVWQRLKHGGVCIADDYGWLKRGVIGPKPAIDGFLASFEGKLKVLSMGYQVVFKKL